MKTVNLEQARQIAGGTPLVDAIVANCDSIINSYGANQGSTVSFVSGATFSTGINASIGADVGVISGGVEVGGDQQGSIQLSGSCMQTLDALEDDKEKTADKQN